MSNEARNRDRELRVLTIELRKLRVDLGAAREELKEVEKKADVDRQKFCLETQLFRREIIECKKRASKFCTMYLMMCCA